MQLPLITFKNYLSFLSSRLDHVVKVVHAGVSWPHETEQPHDQQLKCPLREHGNLPRVGSVGRSGKRVRAMDSARGGNKQGYRWAGLRRATPCSKIVGPTLHHLTA